MSEYHFVVVAGPDQGKELALAEGTGKILGRHQEADYRVTDPHVSRRHCEIQWIGEEIKLVDYGSTSGTFVNGHPIMERVLKEGDVVQIGDTQLRFHVGGPGDESTLQNYALPAEQDALPAEQLDELKGRTLAHFQVGDVLGTGQSGVVFRAVDANDGKAVALKVMQPEFSKHEDEMQRFVLAMKAMMPLHHPNIIGLHGAGKDGPYCWVAMELVEGENMAQVLERIGIAGRLDWKYAFRVAVHIGRALEYAHGQHIVHRNITPRNILMETATKTAKLGDLMLARALDGTLAQQVTKPGQFVGEINYMSPERTHGSAKMVDGRSDLFSLGSTVYALLTGEPPFAAANMLDTITKIRHENPEKPSKFQLGIPGQFEGVVMKLLIKVPEDRYQSATELLKELERVGTFCGVSV